MKFILPTQAVLNAMKCTATADVRYYLDGIHVTKDSVEATNGHFLYQAKLKDCKIPEAIEELGYDFEMPDSMIIRMKQKIAKPVKRSGCQFILFEVNGGEVIATPLSQHGQKMACYLGEIVDGKFPDCDRVIPSGEKEDFECVGFNSAYLKKIDEISDGKYGSVKLKLFGENKAAIFEIMSHSEHYEAIFVLMPIRL